MSISFFPIFENMLNTFFFGYLSLRWRRLVRAIIILLLTPLYLLFLFESLFNGDDDAFVKLVLVFLATLFVCLISYIIKPFVVKED